MEKIYIAQPIFNGNEKKYLNECIDTGWISSTGRFVTEFEKKFAEFCGMKYALACSNGTVTLHLILLSIGLKSQDEVIMPTLTYIATANSVKYCGATPVFVDSDEHTFNMDPQKIEQAITKNTKAIMPVHLYGLMCDMDPINEIAKKYNLLVIEDAAEAHGATYKGHISGSLGHASSFSFFGNKVITCGEGGMIVTNDKELYEKMKILRSQGGSADKRYWHDVVGYNYRMTNMQAAIGCGQLENIDWHLKNRQRVAFSYQKHLSDVNDLVCFQKSDNNYTHSYWMTCLTLTNKVKLTKEDVMAKMEAKNIEMRPLFYPMHTMPPYFNNIGYPIAEKISQRGFCLPSHASLTEEQIVYICDSLKEIIC